MPLKLLPASQALIQSHASKARPMSLDQQIANGVAAATIRGERMAEINIAVVMAHEESQRLGRDLMDLGYRHTISNSGNHIRLIIHW